MSSTSLELRPTRGVGRVEGLLAGLRRGMAESLIPENHRCGRILDIGCGSFPVFLSETRFEERHGIDRVNDGTASELAERGLSMVNQDLERNAELPYRSGHFSVVTMLAVFEHIRPIQLVELLSEVRRVLEPGGMYVMTTPAFWTGDLLKLMAKLQLVSAEEIEEHKHSYSHKEIKDLLQTAGFDSGCIRLGYFEAFMNNWATATR
jgi:2-polyprenyl-3-methyl-5-hydroxy-6-metoxy-1,4-benzoquinol methylase